MGQKWIGAAERVSKPFYEHSIFLDVQLYDEKDGTKRFACPTLAAWWQLIRLGVDREPSGKLRLPNKTISTKNAQPLFARRTLSFLDPNFIQVEHAVRDILRQSVLPEKLTTIFSSGPKSSRPKDVGETIGYIFLPSNTFSDF